MVLRKGNKPKRATATTKVHITDEALNISERVARVLGAVYSVDPDIIDPDFILETVAQDDQDLILRLTVEFKLRPSPMALSVFTTAADIIKFYVDNADSIDREARIDKQVFESYENLINGIAVVFVPGLNSVGTSTLITAEKIGQKSRARVHAELASAFELEIPNGEWEACRTLGDVLDWYAERWTEIPLSVLENEREAESFDAGEQPGVSQAGDVLTPHEAQTLLHLLHTYMPQIRISFEEDPEDDSFSSELNLSILSAAKDGYWSAEYQFSTEDDTGESYSRALLNALQELHNRRKSDNLNQDEDDD